MDAMMTRKVLRRAAEIVDQGWTQGCEARDAFRNQVPFNDPAAVRWCLGGAVNLAALEAGLKHSRPIFTALMKVDYSPSMWNDAPGRTADEVAGLLRRAANHGEEAR